jgi:hypothetical protein
MFSRVIISCTCDQGQGLGSTNSKRGEHKQLTKWPKNHLAYRVHRLAGLGKQDLVHKSNPSHKPKADWNTGRISSWGTTFLYTGLTM